MSSMALLPEKILNYLNAGDVVVAEVPVAVEELRSFVRIRPVPNPEVSREEQRYLNSRYDMWQYWNYSWRRMILRSGWEQDEWNYDKYLLRDEREMTATESEFEALLSKWVSSPEQFQHVEDSQCPE